ncbi:hypothetical protein Nepgr_003447 [Nepenthes gracilis]|uniref:Uncharacterized protein n=1 Tax=Nepenthes gracilis TaxID=150966 RepID=A0AAD3RZM1_NEPGR|nr:hypothetical protein Nepgr_003447 [Nepenthes gracilis]
MQADLPLTASSIISTYEREGLTEIAGEVNEESNLEVPDEAEKEERGAQGLSQHDVLEDEDDYEFSFICGETKSPISAEDIFQNGQIRPLFQFVVEDQNPDTVTHDYDEKSRSVGIPIKKMFVGRSDLSSEAEDANRDEEGPHCAWTAAAAVPSEATCSSPETCKKSNSTGFSKLFRFRDLLIRSYSDGKDAFVFLPSSKRDDKDEGTPSQKGSSTTERKSATNGSGRVRMKSKVAQADTTPEKRAASTYAMQYEKKKGGIEGEKRKSYLPYRQDLVGFFTNVNGMSRNVHPY